MYMTYKDLQEKAKALGIPHVGVSAEDLKKAVEAAEKAQSEDKSEDKPSKTQEEKTPEHNAAIVYNGTREVRRYTRDTHGKNFADLATEFATDRKYTVKLEQVKPGIVCPSCGHVIHL